MVLKIENLKVSYGDKVVIPNLTFEIEDVIRNNTVTGQIVAILGESGCGKSTLFRTLSGLKNYEGSISILDDINNYEVNNPKYKSPIKGDIGFVDQKYTMFRHKTVYNSLMLALRKYNGNKDEKIDEYLSKLNILDIKHKYPNEISGGQRQRAALLERLFNDNHYIILDEPFSGLDIKNRESTKSFIRSIVNEHELNTIIFCTHNISIAVEMADVILVLNKKGELIQQTNLRSKGYGYNQYDQQHINLTKQLKNLLLQ